MTLLLVMAGAAAGAPSRWLLDRFVQSRHDSVFPWGTFAINVLGSLLLGVILGAGAPQSLALLLGTGFCGGFTTFSTFGYETVRLVEDGSSGQAMLNVAASLAAGLAAASAGWYLGAAIAG
ncbi:MAG: fluoride efflux transporter CrcB [Candidatus Nanopelagicales bacterium]|nr:fluoride efflux transporter CrcB [Candidatus Nanopelagicales bacterium]